MKEEGMDLSKLWEAWPIEGPWHLSPLRGGKNNRVWRADTADGHSYVLRLSSDLGSLARVRYEAALLEAVAHLQPPFLLALPLQALHGDILVPFEEEGASSFAILSPLLPGRLPEDWSDLILATNAGYTLGWLDRALATLPEMHPSGAIQSLPAFGELALLHPRIPNPLAAVEQLPIDQDHMRQIRRVLTAVTETVADLYHRLPQQVLHRDYDPGNILVEHHRVTAVLDFEFAGPDLRVLDICIALSWWSVDVLGTGREWDVIDTFGKAYITLVPLSVQELLAFPDIWRLRDAASFIHRMGRYFAGLETDTRMQERVQHSLWREAWLSAHRETLVQHALAWEVNEEQ